MHRTIKLSFVPSDARFLEALAELRLRQSRVIRTAYCQLAEGMALNHLYRALRTHPVGQGLHS